MNIDKYISELFELLSIPSVSAQSEHKKDILSAAKWLRKRLKKLGFKSEILPTAGHPVVYAENLKAGKNKPTVLIYGHYDVQDTGNLKEWKSEPFKPVVKAGNIYARGASDDKGNSYTWIAAIDEFTKSGKSELPVNVKFLFEGEEEIASKSLREFMGENRSLLKADYAIVADTACVSEEQPLIEYGLRGIIYYNVTVKTLTQDVHSGTFGGNVLNPINVLAFIISKVKNDKHRILVPGFYENVRKLPKTEKIAAKKFPLNEKDVIQKTGARMATGEAGYSVVERKGARPSFDVNGVWGGYQGEGPKTVIPQSAGAKFSFRLVANQNAKDITRKFEKYIKQITPKGAEVTLELLGADNPIITDLRSPFIKPAEKALEKVFGKKPLYHLEGGSIPVTAIFKEILGIESLLMGYALPDDAHHGPNEKMSVSMFEKGIRTNIEFLKNL